jgi:hypothetical protein
MQELFGKWTELIGTHSFSIVIDTRQFQEITIVCKHALLIASLIPLAHPITYATILEVLLSDKV